jgi:hypothetical protein
MCGDAAVFDVVILLDSAVELADRGGKETGWEPGEVVAEEVGGEGGRQESQQRRGR